MRRGRRSDAGVRRRLPPVLRLHLFNRAKPTNGDISVARYDDDGARYVRTTLVEPGTPSVLRLFQDKINLAVDQSSGRATSGNV